MNLFRPSNIPSGLKGYWKLDESSGQRNDSSGNGNHLTDNNSVGSQAVDYFRTGERSADFESSSSQYLSITDASQNGLDMTGDYSIACWINLESTGVAQTIVDKGLAANAGYSFRITSGNILQAANANAVSSALTALTAGKWNHVAVTYDSIADIFTFYINGNVDNVVSNATSPTDSPYNFEVGRTAGGGNLFDGMMKDLAIWNIVLTPAQVKSLAMGIDLTQSGKNNIRPDKLSIQPASWWKLNERSHGGSAVTRNDSIGSNHLTDVNTVTTKEGFIEGAGARFTRANSEYLSGGNIFNLTSSYSLVATVKITSSNPDMNIISKWSPNTGWTWVIRPSLTGISVYHNNIQYGPASFNFKLNTWYILGAVYDSSQQTIKHYVDGKLIGTLTGAAAPSSTSHDFRIGIRGDGADGFDGIIADAAIFNGVLTSSDMKLLAEAFDWQRSGLVSYWKLNEASGTRFDDLTNNDLSDNNGVSQGAGVVGNSADFESTNSQFLKRPNASLVDLNLTSDMSLLAWANPESTGILHYIFERNVHPTGTGYALSINASNQFNFFTNAGSISSTSTVSASNWFHAAGINTGSERQIYFNSVREGSGGTSTNPLSNTQDFFLGGTKNNSNFFDGRVDEALIFKRWLREEEVKVIYTRNLNGDEAALKIAPIQSGMIVFFYP